MLDARDGHCPEWRRGGTDAAALLLARPSAPQGGRAAGLHVGGGPPFRGLHQSRLHQLQPGEKSRYRSAVAESNLLGHHLVKNVSHLGHRLSVDIVGWM